jgi:hypothetical protein
MKLENFHEKKTAQKILNISRTIPGLGLLHRAAYENFYPSGMRRRADGK